MGYPVYEEIYNQEIISTIQSRYADETQQLRALNFNEAFYISELAPYFSALIVFPILALMWHRGAVLRINGMLQVRFLNIYMLHEDTYAYSVASKNFGIKYTTMFDDGTMLHTVTRKMGGESQPKYRYVYQEAQPENITTAWQKHVQIVEGLARGERSVVTILGIGDIMRMERHSDQILMGGAPRFDSDVAKKKKF